LPIFDDVFRDKFIELLKWRRDVRRFKADPVPPKLLDDLLTAADLAPSVGLSQPWRFVTVDDPGRRSAIRRNFEACNKDALAHMYGERAASYAQLKLAGLDEAPCHLAVFAETAPVQGHGLGRRTMPETLNYSTVIAVHTLWLLARTSELGLGWISILDPIQAAQALDVPPSWNFIGYFCVGYPQEENQVPELELLEWEHRQITAVHHLKR